MSDREISSFGLTPLQEGMLFHQLSQGGQGVDIEQISIKISHSLDIENFQKAWASLTEQHEVLRTAFTWDSEQDNRQIVRQDVVLPQREFDWSGHDEISFLAKLDEFLSLDRLNDFDLARAPLMRLALIHGPNNIFYCVWTFHHILLDGRSFPLLLKELFANYESLQNGCNFSFPKRVPFSEYVSWLSRRDKSRELAFWSNELLGIDSESKLNLQKTRVNASGQKYGFEALTISVHDTKLLNDFATQHGITQNTLLQAAWSLILHHYTRDQDIVFGSTRACRHGGVKDAENILGLLINTVPFRVRIDEKITLLELLQQVRDKHVLLREFEFTPLQDIRKASKIKSELMFETLLVFDSATLNSRMQDQSEVCRQREFQYRGQTNFPLALIAYGGEEFSLRLEFDLDKYSREKISELLVNLKNLLINFPEQANRLAAQVDYLNQDQVAKLTSDTINESKTVYSEANATIASLFENIVDQMPDKKALQFEDDALSYLELNEKVNGLAFLLIEQGIKVGDFVGVCCERSLELMISLLAIIKVGAAYVPLDPDYPVDRLDFTISDTSAKIVLTQFALKAKLESSQAQIICVDRDEISSVNENPNIVFTPEDLAYVLYTSGSTGRPKGVMNSHRGIVNRLVWMRDEYQVGPNDIILQKTPYSFDVSVWEFFLPVISGATLVLAKPGGHKDGGYLAEIIAKQKITILHFVPSMLRLFLDEDNLAVSCRSVRHVICSGEALMPDICQRFFSKVPAALHNLYGPTEAAVDVTYWQCTPENSSTIVPIGHVVANTYLYVLDKFLRPVPQGQIGEFYIGGVQVAEGYLNREELTEQCFIADPYNPDKNARLYKTGDLGSRREDGAFEYHGRIDHQVKLRGMRIELGEIEVAIETHENIKQAIALVREDVPGTQKLVAYLSFHPNVKNDFTVKDFRTYLESRLPEHMVPAQFVILDEFPLTISGKVDRKLLPVPESDRPDLGEEYIAPSSEIERQVAEVWESVLGLEKVGVRDDYFDLGGDSILTIKIVAQLKKRGFTSSPKQVFQSKTIENLAKQLTPLNAMSIRQEKVIGKVGLLPAQQWFFDQQFEQIDYWNQAFLFDLVKPLEHSLLEKSLVLLVDHHDEFRACFSNSANGFEKIISEKTDAVELDFYDFANETKDQAEKAISSQCEVLQASLNITMGKVFSFAYFKSPESLGDKLFICFHHLVSDGVSWNILLQDIEANYQGLKNSKSNEDLKPNKTSSTKDWLANLLDYTSTQAYLSNIVYWDQIQEGRFDKISLQSQSDNRDCHLKSVIVLLDEERTDTLLRRCHRPYNTQINDLLLTALSNSLSQAFQLQRFTIDVEGHGREDLFSNLDLSRTIGWFTSIFPVSIQPKPSQNWKDSIISIKEQLRAVPNQGFDFLLAKYLNPASDQANRESFKHIEKSDVLFNYMGQFDQTLADTSLFRFSELDSGPWHGAENHRSHALEVLGWVKRGCLEFSINYSEGCFKAGEIDELGKLFKQALLGVIDHCAKTETRSYSASDFPLLSISQQDVTRLSDVYPFMCDAYPMSAMQDLFYAADVMNPESGFEQWQFLLTGPLDLDRYKAAWQATIDKHDILRTCFVKDHNGKALQLVVEDAPLDWSYVDLSSRNNEEKKVSLQEIVDSDRKTPFQLDRAPLVRIAVVKLNPNSFHLIWSTHHLCIDGWSWPLVFKDVSAAYQQVNRLGATQLKGPQFKEYITWLGEQNFSSIKDYWKKLLAGYKSAIAFDRSSSIATKTMIHRDYIFSADLTTQLDNFAREASVTLSTLFQGLWSLVLGRASNRKDLVFGISSAGRPHDINDVSEIVGPFVNNIPNRISLEKLISEEESLVDWLQSIQEVNLSSSIYETTPLLEIQECSELPLSQRLFESLLVFQNYTSGASTERLSAEVGISPIDLPQSTNYPLTLAVSPGQKLGLSGYFQSGYFSEQEITALFQDIEGVANQVLQNKPIAMIYSESGSWKVRAKSQLGSELLDDDSVVGDTESQQFSSDIEKTITKIWLAAFGLSKISRRRSFFELGGQSVMLVSVHAQIQERLQRQFSITDFFKYPSIEKLSSFLNGAGSEEKLDAQKHKDNAQLKKLAMRKKKMKSRKS